METFFTRDKDFYKRFFGMFFMVALQNLIAYSVNMTDNIMLGNYGQNALSGATTVNQIFFLVQSFTTSIGTSMATLCSQYWGKNDPDSIKTIGGISLRFSAYSGLVIIAICEIFSYPLLRIFTSSEAIISEGQAYLSIVQWSFLLFILTNTFMSLLRSIGTVRISFWVSLISFVVNVSINYTLIFGHFGFPEMGIRGAGVGTLIARSLELVIVFIYTLKVEKKIHFSGRMLFLSDSALRRDFFKLFIPTVFSQMLWAISVPMQTAILGHISDDALAANSVATTVFQYLKVIVTAMASTSAVVIGNTIGEGNIERVRQDGRTISIMNLISGIILGLILLALRRPLLSMYSLSDTAMLLASHLIVILSVIMVGMAYHMPIMTGIFAGGGDVKFRMYTNLISTWLIVMPLSFAAAFWWKLPVEIVVICIQSDQIFKCIPCAWRLHHYKWIHNLTEGQGAVNE